MTHILCYLFYQTQFFTGCIYESKWTIRMIEIASYKTEEQLKRTWGLIDSTGYHSRWPEVCSFQDKIGRLFCLPFRVGYPGYFNVASFWCMVRDPQSRIVPTYLKQDFIFPSTAALILSSHLTISLNAVCEANASAPCPTEASRYLSSLAHYARIAVHLGSGTCPHLEVGWFLSPNSRFWFLLFPVFAITLNFFILFFYYLNQNYWFNKQNWL